MKPAVQCKKVEGPGICNMRDSEKGRLGRLRGNRHGCCWSWRIQGYEPEGFVLAGVGVIIPVMSVPQSTVFRGVYTPPSPGARAVTVK